MTLLLNVFLALCVLVMVVVATVAQMFLGAFIVGMVFPILASYSLYRRLRSTYSA